MPVTGGGPEVGLVAVSTAGSASVDELGRVPFRVLCKSIDMLSKNGCLDGSDLDGSDIKGWCVARNKRSRASAEAG